MPENLEPIARGKTIELQHDRRIKRRHVAMPDVARHAGKEDVGVAAFERLHHWHRGNGMALPEIFAQEEGVDPGGVAAHDHVLVIVRKNLRLDEITGAKQFRHRASFAHRAKRTLTKLLVVVDVRALQFLSRERGKLFAVAKSEMPSQIDAFEPGQRAHSHVVELRQQERIDKMPAIDRELWIVDGLFGNLKT